MLVTRVCAQEDELGWIAIFWMELEEFWAKESKIFCFGAVYVSGKDLIVRAERWTRDHAIQVLILD